MTAPLQNLAFVGAGALRQTPRMSKYLFPMLLFTLAGCETSVGSTPTTPTTPTSNQAPTISGMTVSPAFGMASVTPFALSASASDPDGDAVTFAWTFGGTTINGQTGTAVFGGEGTQNVQLRVTDARGASTTQVRSVTIGNMSGSWSGSIDLNVCLPGVTKPATATLQQSGGSVTGTIFLPQGLCTFQPGSAVTDPAEPGTVSSTGLVRVRIKIPPFTDVYFEGNIDSTGRRWTGGLRGSGHNGTPFVLNKQ